MLWLLRSVLQRCGVVSGGGGGGAGAMNDLSDVDTATTAPQNNQVLKWVAASSKWIPADDLSGGGSGSGFFKQVTNNNTIGIGTTANVSVGPTAISYSTLGAGVAGLTVHSGLDIADGVIEAPAGENKIPSLYANLAALPNAGTYHGMFAHVHSEGKGYFAHAGNWLELVNKDTSGNVSLGGDLDVVGNLEVGTGSTTYTNGLIVSKQGAEFQGVVTASSFSGETLKSRAYVHGTTGSLAVNATGNLSITGHKSYALLNVGVSTAAWVRLYTDSASRGNDAGRSIGEDPSSGSGVIADIVTTGFSTSQVISPGTIGFNNDTSPSQTIYVSVKNMGIQTQPVTVNLQILQLESNS